MLDKFDGLDLTSKYLKEKSLIEIINTLKDFRKDPKKLQKYNNLIITLIIGLRNLNSDVKNMSEDEVENKRLDYLKDLVRKIVNANQELDDSQI